MKKILQLFDGNDALIVAGLAGLGAGLYLVSPRVMLIVMGTALLLIGLVGAWRKGA